MGCSFSRSVDKGLEHYLLCSKTGIYCKYQKYCYKQKRAINTDNYINCSLIDKEENKMAKSTSSKKSSTNSVKKNNEQEKHYAYYEVLVATPHYYILNVNGCPTKIYGENNYKKGDYAEM